MKKIIAFILVNIFFAMPISPPIVYAKQITYSTTASWNEYYLTEEEMLNDADLVIIGSVENITTEVRYDMVFTKNFISIDKIYLNRVDIQDDELIPVLQTGGSCNGITTPAIDDCTLLKNKTQYKFYLQYIPQTEQYDDYYLILGGYQGVIEINDIFKNQKLENIIFSNKNEFKINATSTTYTPRAQGNYYWNKSNLKILVPSSIGTTYKTNTRAGICDGVSSWRLCSDAPSVTIQSAPGGGSDIAISMQNYGATGWDGYSTTYYNTATKICSSSKIQINCYYYKSDADLNDRIFWKALSAHEMGHSLGLGHNTNYTVTSVMRPYTKDYYDRYSDWPRIATAREADIYTINTIY